MHGATWKCSGSPLSILDLSTYLITYSPSEPRPDYSCTGMRRLGLSRSQKVISCRHSPADDLYGSESGRNMIVIVRTVFASTADTRLLRHSQSVERQVSGD